MLLSKAMLAGDVIIMLARKSGSKYKNANCGELLLYSSLETVRVH